MEIKFTEESKKKSEVTYPTLRKWTTGNDNPKNFTVLFFAPCVGVVVKVKGDVDRVVGEFDRNFSFDPNKKDDDQDQWTETHGETVFKC